MPTRAVIPREEPSQETGLRAGGGADPRPDGSADDEADHGMRDALGLLKRWRRGPRLRVLAERSESLFL